MKISSRILTMLLLLLITISVEASTLVILHTNDTHSQIEPNDKNLGGVLRRKALIDSVKNVYKHVLVVDAGDVVQGTTYFNLYKGEAEQRLMNELGYDLRILGNHEFDNGIEGLKSMLKESKSIFLSTNYLFEDSLLRTRFAPYRIFNIEGKKIGFIALNINPQGLVSDGNYEGVIYQDAFTTANNVAKQLKEQYGVDLVVALTHLGYSDDVRLAELSHHIDVIIGGHSHTLVNVNDENSKLPHKVFNQDGNPVIIAQADKAGRYVGEITIDIDSKSIATNVISVDSRFDKSVDADMKNIIASYKKGVDELMNQSVATIDMDLKKEEASLQNFVCDMVYSQAKKLYAGKIDLAITNKGGIRCDLSKGDVSVGNVMSMLPFNNRIVILEVKGCDLQDAFDVMASRGGDCVSAGVEAIIDSTTKKCVSIKINGAEIDSSKTYILATIDYLADGGDYMTSLTNGRKISGGDKVLYDEMIDFIKTQNKVSPSLEQRMRVK